MNDPYFDMIDSYFDGSISEKNKKSLIEHLSTCPSCKREFEISKKLFDALHSIKPIAPPADFMSKLNERFDQEDEFIRKRNVYSPRIKKYSTAVAACLLIAVLVQYKTVDMFNTTNNPIVDLAGEDVSPVSDTLSENLNQPEKNVQNDNDLVENITKSELVNNADLNSKSEIAERSIASTIIKPTVKPAKNEKKEIPSSTPEVDKSNIENSLESQNPITANVNSDVSNNDLSVKPTPTENVQDNVHLNSLSKVILASSVEKDYQTTEIKLEDLPVKERDLAKEFALLENTKTGVAIATPVNLSYLGDIEVQKIVDNRSKGSKDYGIGSGSLFISSENKEKVNELLSKYLTDEENSVYFLTSENYKSFVDDMESNGITYEKQLIIDNGNNITFKVVVG